MRPLKALWMLCWGPTVILLLLARTLVEGVARWLRGDGDGA